MQVVFAARKKKFTPEIRAVARDEGRPANFVMEGVATGKIVIPKNLRRKTKATGIGEGLRTKINVNVGTSPGHADVREEVEKAKLAVRCGADTIMDLSTGGDIDRVRRQILRAVKVPVGTVPIYQAAIEAARRGSVVDMSSDDIFNAIRMHAKDGVDFLTVHCGVTKSVVDVLKRSGRLLNVVSRGGALLSAWIIHNNRENPLYEEFDYLLELAREFDLTLSLGDGMRPGCLADASDQPQIQELLVLGELVERAREKEVQVMVEGPGHLPLDHVEANVSLEKTICKGAPFYVLGPVVTDVAPGYDHITAGIGGALSAMFGTDFLCAVTPSEHLGLPTLDDIRKGTIVTKIAAHVGDIVKLGKGASGMDSEMAKARASLNWEKQLKLAIDPERARRLHHMKKGTPCTMCGEYCAIKILSEFLMKPKLSRNIKHERNKLGGTKCR